MYDALPNHIDSWFIICEVSAYNSAHLMCFCVN
jgi:hypothetical protein